MIRSKEKKSKIFSNMVYIYTKLVQSHHKFLLITLTIIGVDVLIPILNALFPKFILSAAQNAEHTYYMLFVTLAVFFLLTSPTKAISNYFVRRNNFYLSNMGIKLKEDIQRKSLKMDYSMTEDPEVLNKIQTAYNCTDHTAGIVHVICGVCSSAVILLVCGILIVYFNIWFLVFLLLNLLINILVLNKTRKYESDQREIRSEVERKKNYLFQTMFDYDYGKDIRVFNMNHILVDKYQKQKQRKKELYAQAQSRQFIFSLVEGTLTLIREVLLYVLLLRAYISGGVTIDNFMMYVSLVASFSAAAKTICEHVSQVIFLSPYVTDYREFVEQAEGKFAGKSTSGGKSTCSVKDFSVEFRNVSFSYPGSETMVLRNVSFTIRAGQHAALVGLNGSGKTTIVKLLCGFYKPQQGDIFVGGKNISEIDQEEYRWVLSAVFQDSRLYAFTLEENVYAGLEPDKQKLWEILRQLRMDGAVQGLKKQEQSQVLKNLYEDGVEFSGGEVQRLCIARAMYRDSGIILLDEPTAALDALAEKELYENFDRIAKGKTTVFISHRLNSNRFCDTVIYLEDGQVTAQGSHESLYSACAAYRNLYDLQAQYYVKYGEGAFV